MTEEQYIAKKDLYRYQNAKKDLKHLVEKLSIMEESIDPLSKREDGVIVCGGQNLYGLSMDALADMQIRYKNKQHECEVSCMQIDDRINVWTSGVHQRILREFYIFGKSFEEIVDIEGYAYSTIAHYHLSALTEYGRELKTMQVDARLF